MSEIDLTSALKNQIKPVANENWDNSVDAMHNYLTLLKQHAEAKTELAKEKLEEHEEDMDMLKKKRRKRRNYGTRTGIVLQDGSDTSFEL